MYGYLFLVLFITFTIKFSHPPWCTRSESLHNVVLFCKLHGIELLLLVINRAGQDKKILNRLDSKRKQSK